MANDYYELKDLMDLLNPMNVDYSKQIISFPQYEKQQIQAKLKAIKAHLNEKYPLANVVFEKNENEKYQFFIQLEVYGGMCRSIVIMEFDFQSHTLKIHIQFAEIDGRIQVQQKMLRLQLGRYMLRLNAQMTVGSFYINPIYGYVGLNLSTLSSQQFRQYLISEETYHQGLFPYLDRLIFTALKSMQFNFMRIYFLMNRIKIKDFLLYEEYMEKQRKMQEWRKLPIETGQLLSRIKHIVKNNMELPFTQEELKNYGSILAKSVIMDQKLLKEISVENMKDLEKFKTNEKINEGQFCIIYGKQIEYKLLNKKNDYGKNEQVQRNLVIKKQKNLQLRSVEREIEILQILASDINTQGNELIRSNGCCPFIAQFYYIENKKEILLMERYFHLSLDIFKEKYKEILSLTTKLYIALCIAMGLRYIHSYEIVHMDVKPSNILISKTLMAKITDFGDSTNLNQKGNIKPGHILPYLAPERVQGKQITAAYDIFGFGILLFELIFCRYPIDFKNKDIKDLEKRYQDNSYQLRYDEEYASTMGPQVIVKYLGRMCIQCLQPEPEKRPNINKICLVLKDCLTYLDKIY